MKKILVACGAGIATSTIVCDRVEARRSRFNSINNYTTNNLWYTYNKGNRIYNRYKYNSIR